MTELIFKQVIPDNSNYIWLAFFSTGKFCNTFEIA